VQPAHVEIAELLAGSNHAVILTGAGISTESGIPDFRSPGGVWEEFDPFEVASMSTFMADPKRFWRFHRPRIDMLSGVEPNAAHRAVAALEDSGIVKGLITQNIDRLHAVAGSPNPIEVHGSLSAGVCLRCQIEVSMNDLVRRADDSSDGVPRCDECGFQLKSRVVMFGEPLPEAAIDAAFAHAEAADVMLVVGSSLAVSPVSQLPEVCLSRGGRLAILTEGETPYDDRCTVRSHGRAGEVLPRVVDTLAGMASRRGRA
jgi:NAD-dependent deacetylase